MTLLEKYIAKVGEMRKTPLNEERESVAEIHNAALDEVQSLLPELIKEVQEDVVAKAELIVRTMGQGEVAPLLQALASLKEPNIK